MPYEISDQEFTSVINLSARERYSHFIKRVADWEEIWSLKSESGWILSGVDNERAIIPVWPHPRYAEVCALGYPGGSYPKLIIMNEWLNQWIPGLINDNRLVTVFPTPEMKGITIEPYLLKKDLEDELSNYD